MPSLISSTSFRIHHVVAFAGIASLASALAADVFAVRGSFWRGLQLPEAGALTLSLSTTIAAMVASPRRWVFGVAGAALIVAVQAPALTWRVRHREDFAAASSGADSEAAPPWWPGFERGFRRHVARNVRTQERPQVA